MGIGKQRTSLGVRLAARVADAKGPVLEIVRVVAPEHVRVVAVPERDPVVAELEHDPVAAELEIVPVAALELEIGPAAERERGQVAVVLEHDPVAVAVPGHQRAQLAVRLRIKSVTAAHRRGLVPVLAAEDLAAAAETTREPAAAEAAVAWEVAE